MYEIAVAVVVDDANTKGSHIDQVRDLCFSHIGVNISRSPKLVFIYWFLDLLVILIAECRLDDVLCAYMV